MMKVLFGNPKRFVFIFAMFLTVLSLQAISFGEPVPNVMLRVVHVTPDWHSFAPIGGWPSAVSLKESEVLKFYEVAIWEETSSVHLYAFSNDYDPHYGGFGDKTDAQIIAYRERFVIKKYTDMPEAWTHERSHFLQSAFTDIASYLVDEHPRSEHHLMYSGHGGPGGRLFGAQLDTSHANTFLNAWTSALGKPLGVIDMGGPCNKGSFADLDNFCEYANYYIASDLPNGGYTMDDWTIEKWDEIKPETQYHNLFAANSALEDVLIALINLKRKRYEYSRNNMISNQVAQGNYLYSCAAFRTFSPDFKAFLNRVGVDYQISDDLYQYMIDNKAPQTLITQFNDVFVHKADNKDFFQWQVVSNGLLMPEPGVLSQIAPEITELPQLPEDVNKDGVVNIQDLVLVASNLGQTGTNPADVNGDDVVDIRDLVLVAGAFGEGVSAAPTLHPSDLEGLTAAEVQDLLTQARQLALTDPAYLRGIVVLEQLLARLLPKETALLPNYPNPFNPETWIPYQLSKPTDVTLTIYDIKGSVVRALDLGHQRAGVYQNRSRAAYWDGRNALGEKVASGVYFYTLTAGEFSATRKLLIRK